MKLPHKQRENPYSLITISRDSILYKNGIIHFETKSVKIMVKGQKIVILFNVLFLSKDKTILRMPFLQKFNLKINWITETVKIKNI